MASEVREVGVIVEKRPSASPWADVSWHVTGVITDPPAVETWSTLRQDGDVTDFYAGSAAIELHSIETGNYRDNLAAARPSLWVVLLPADTPTGLALSLVTADPAEGEAFTEAGEQIVEAVPMPEAVQHWVAAFVRTHHVERPFIKRKRDR